MSTSPNRIVFAKEVMINLKRIGISFFLSVIFFSSLYFVNKSNYNKVSQESIYLKPTAPSVEVQSSNEAPNKYEALRQKMAKSDEQNVIEGRSMEEVSKYDGNVVLGQSTQSIYKNRERNFFDNIIGKSTLPFIYLSCFLIIGRYLLMVFRWISRTSKLNSLY